MADEAGPSGVSTALVEAPEGHAGSDIRPILQYGRLTPHAAQTVQIANT